MEGKVHHRYRHAALGELRLSPRFCLLWAIMAMIALGVFFTG
jgi:hypothetical protein